MKQLKIRRPLAEDRADQHGHNQHTMDHVPGHPHIPGNTMDILLTIRTPCVIEASSSQALQTSATSDHANTLTRRHGHMVTILGDVYPIQIPC